MKRFIKILCQNVEYIDRKLVIQCTQILNVENALANGGIIKVGNEGLLTGSGACDERHDTCKGRMDSQSDDIKEIFRTKVSKEIMFWTLGIFFLLIIGSYGYTTTIAEKVDNVVTTQDMKAFKTDIVDAIKAIKQ